MKGKTVLVTGSTDGIGKQTALELARLGARVILHGRSRQKGRKTLQEIQRATGATDMDYLSFDLSSQANVRALAEAFEQQYPRLDVLIHNAGIYSHTRHLTPDHVEMTFAVNHLAPFLLTHLLLGLLKKSAPSRVVTVSSMAHHTAEIDLKNLQQEKRFDAYDAYALSKLANVLFAYALSDRLKGSGVTSNALHPGVIDTKLLRSGFHVRGDSVEKGAGTSVYLACAAELEKTSGKYFNKGEEESSSPITYDKRLQEELWGISERLTGIRGS